MKKIARFDPGKWKGKSTFVPQLFMSYKIIDARSEISTYLDLTCSCLGIILHSESLSRHPHFICLL